MWIESRRADRAASNADAYRDSGAHGHGYADPYVGANFSAYVVHDGRGRDCDVLERTADVGSPVSTREHIGDRHVAQPDDWRLLWGWTPDHPGDVSHDVGRGCGLWECDQRFHARDLGVV
jgi:hypothetical protein